jgi:hypothetical protein
MGDVMGTDRHQQTTREPAARFSLAVGLAYVAGRCVRLWPDRRGNIAPIMALMLVPLIALVGVATEGSYWLLTQRSMQNAADASVLAAATSADATLDAGGAPRYAREAASVATQYGFTDDVANTVVTTVNAVACPDGSGPLCYQVSISRNLGLSFVQLIGFSGDATADGRKAVSVLASAIAEPATSSAPICLLTLASAKGLVSNGAPDVNLAGCFVFSDSTATCHGGNLGATYGGAVGTDSNCGNITRSNMPTVSDPYASLAANIPPNTCGASASGYATTSPHLLSGSYTGAELSQNVYCGNVALGGAVTVTAGNAVITVENGSFDLAGATIETAPGAGLTLIFTGSPVSGLSPSSYMIDSGTGGSGVFNVAAPTAGPWSGVSIYQDPSLPAGSQVDFNYAGNAPTWDITGLAYFPNANVQISGAVNKSGNGANCFVFVSSTLTINGTGSIFANPTSQCDLAGLVAPSAIIVQRAKLVL